MDIYVIVGILLALGVVLVIIAPFIKKILQEGVTQEEERLPYKIKKYFFNTSEQQFFNILEKQIDHSRFSIFPKVRLGDFIETTNEGDERWGSWNRIKSRHVDFLIFDTQKSSIAVAIELDGSSHNSERAQKSDDFKDKLHSAIGLELVRVRVGTDFASEIAKIIHDL